MNVHECITDGKSMVCLHRKCFWILKIGYLIRSQQCFINHIGIYSKINCCLLVVYICLHEIAIKTPLLSRTN